MAKPKKQEPEDEAVIMKRMNGALKKMMSTPPETHEEMMRPRRGKAPKTTKKRAR